MNRATSLWRDIEMLVESGIVLNLGKSNHNKQFIEKSIQALEILVFQTWLLSATKQIVFLRQCSMHLKRNYVPMFVLIHSSNFPP